MIIKAVETDYAMSSLHVSPKDKLFVFNDGNQIGENKLDLASNAPKEGFILLEKNGNITMVITDGNYIFEKRENDIVKEVNEEVVDIESYFYDIISNAKFVINNNVILNHSYYMETRYINGSSGPDFQKLIIDAIDIDGNNHIIEHQDQLIEATGDVINIIEISNDLKGIFVPKIGELGRFSVHFYHDVWEVDIVYLGEIIEINHLIDGNSEIYEGTYDWTSNVGGSGEEHQYKYTYIPFIN